MHLADVGIQRHFHCGHRWQIHVDTQGAQCHQGRQQSQQPGGTGAAHDPRAKIRQILKDRLNFESNLDLTTVKRYVADPLRFCVEETGLPPS